jgi:hypothetical protein
MEAPEQLGALFLMDGEEIDRITGGVAPLTDFGSPIIDKIWPPTLNKPLQSYFIVREARYLSRVTASNGLAELDLYLRHSRLRVPVLEVLGSDEFRLSITETVAGNSEIPPPETMPDLVAEALARRDFAGAIRLLQSQKELGGFGLNDLFLLAYVYCLNGEVKKAEDLAASNSRLIEEDWFVDWLWGKL